jgi:uncharacterized damage-inducible protein DinB
MEVSDFRYLLAYDRWATLRVLDAAVGADDTVWSAPNEIGERGLGGILVHQYGALARWRHGLSGASGPRPRPEAEEELLSLPDLRTRFEAEWDGWTAWLGRLSAEHLRMEEEGIRLDRALLHVFNHGTQHRSEAAALLTRSGASPGDLDLLDFIVEHGNDVGQE